MDKFIYFSHLNQEVKLETENIHYTQSDKFQAFFTFDFDGYGVQLIKTQNSVS